MSDNRPRVSIVIPTYNHAHFLGEAIESVLGQGVSPIEVIVVDDGSRDDPGAVVARFPNVRVIRQANAGLAAARNTGWRAASGPYVVFLDADDRLLPGALSANLDIFSVHPGCGFVYGTYRIIRVDGSLRKEGKFTEIGAEPFKTFLRGNVIRMHATVMYRREVLEEVGGFDPAMRACEDYELYLRLSRLHPVASHRICVAEYRQHEGNMSRQFSFMLHWALVALRRQKVEAGRSPSLRAAYEEGLRNWKRLYLHKQVEALRQARTAAALSEFIKVALAAPDQFVRLGVGVLLRPLARGRL